MAAREQDWNSSLLSEATDGGSESVGQMIAMDPLMNKMRIDPLQQALNYDPLSAMSQKDELRAAINGQMQFIAEERSGFSQPQQQQDGSKKPSAQELGLDGSIDLTADMQPSTPSAQELGLQMQR